jgi:hypothetical protein
MSKNKLYKIEAIREEHINYYVYSNSPTNAKLEFLSGNYEAIGRKKYTKFTIKRAVKCKRSLGEILCQFQPIKIKDTTI